MRTRKYDYDFIVNLYQEGKSAREVAQQVGCSYQSVSAIVKRAGVSRSKIIRLPILQERAKHCPVFSKDFTDYLDGLLISDGSLFKPSKHVKTSGYTQHSISVSWLECIAEFFCRAGVECSVNPTTRATQHYLHTWRYDQFYRQYCRWYCCGEKRVPKDIDISSRFVLKNWVYGDGTLGSDFRFCTDSFNVEDIEFLLSELEGLGFHFRKMRVGESKTGRDKYRLSICKRTGMMDFFEYVGEPEVAYFSYKWPGRGKCLSSA